MFDRIIILDYINKLITKEEAIKVLKRLGFSEKQIEKLWKEN